MSGTKSEVSLSKSKALVPTVLSARRGRDCESFSVLDVKELGQRIRALRKQRVWTQWDLAHRTGLKLQTVKAIENGRRNARPDTIRAIGAAFDLDARALVKTTTYVQPATAGDFGTVIPQTRELQLNVLSQADLVHATPSGGELIGSMGPSSATVAMPSAFCDPRQPGRHTGLLLAERLLVGLKPAIVDVGHVDEREDQSGRAYIGTLGEGGYLFGVHCQTVQGPQVILSKRQLDVWLKLRTYTLVLAWSRATYSFYLVDWIGEVLKLGGVGLAADHIPVELDECEIKFSLDDITKRDLLIRYLNDYCVFWTHSQSRADAGWSLGGLRSELLLTVARVTQTPEVLRILPFEAKLNHLVNSCGGAATSIKESARLSDRFIDTLLATMRQPVAANPEAIASLAAHLGLPWQDNEILGELNLLLEHGRLSFATTGNFSAEATFGALRWVRAFIGGSLKSINNQLNGFSAKMAWPIGGLLTLLPRDLVLARASELALTRGLGWSRIYAIYFLRSHGYFGDRNYIAHLRAIQRGLLQEPRTDTLRELADMELELTLAALGDDAARSNFLRKIRTKAGSRYVKQVDIDYYISGEESVDTIVHRAESKLAMHDESNRFLGEIIRLRYEPFLSAQPTERPDRRTADAWYEAGRL